MIDTVSAQELSQETPLPLYKETNFQTTPEGKIPKDWQNTALEEVATNLIGGGTPSTAYKEYWNGNIAWMTSAHINGIKVTKGQKYIAKEGLEKSATHLVPKDNLLVATRVGIGKVAVNQIDIAISQDLTGVIIDKTKADPSFLYWAILSNKQKLMALAQGSTIKGILRDDLGKLKLPMPPNVAEQRAIVGVLGVVDSAIEYSDRIVAKTERLKRGLMQQLLTRGIGHKETKQTPIGNIPKTWEPISLSKVFKLSSGKPRPANISEKASSVTPYPIYGGNGILGYSSKFLLNHQTIVIGRVGEYCGAVYESSERSWITDNALYATELSNDFDITFLKYLLSFMNLNKFQKKMGQPLITQTILYGIDIPRPPLREQYMIVDILSTVERKLELEKEEKLRLETIKRGLMDLLLTGKVRIKVD